MDNGLQEVLVGHKLSLRQWGDGVAEKATRDCIKRSPVKYLGRCSIPHVECRIPFQVSHVRMDADKVGYYQRRSDGGWKQYDGEI